MSKKEKEVPAVKKVVRVETVTPYVLHERRKSAFTDGELWAIAERDTDELQMLLGVVPKDYIGYVRIENAPAGMKVGMLSLKPDGTVWIRDALKTFRNEFVYRMADSDIVEVGTWTLQLFESINEDNEYGAVKITASGKEFTMMCKKTMKNGAVRFNLKPPYESDEVAAKFNAERAEREANVAAARRFTAVSVL